MITIKMENKEVLDMLRTVRANVSNTRPLMSEVGDIMISSIDKNFQQGGRPSKWKPSIRAKKQGGQTLVDRGHLASSINKKVRNDSVEVGTNKKYAPIHQFGGKAGRGRKVTIPQRPFLVFQSEDIIEMNKAAKNFLLRGVRR